MLGLLVAVVVTISAVWVYLDATKNGIGKLTDGSGFFNLSAGGWATVTLLLWIVGFPCYLVKREALIMKAKKSPVVVSGRTWKTLVLLAVGGYFIAGQAFTAIVVQASAGSEYVEVCANHYYEAAQSLPQVGIRNDRGDWVRTCKCISGLDGGQTAEDFRRNASVFMSAHINNMQHCAR